MEFKELIQKRYSCKKYADTPVEKEKLTAILEAGRLAPTARNLQPQHIYVIQSKEGLEKVDQCTICRYSAPCVLLITYDKNNVYQYPETEQNSGPEDMGIVATHMILAAANEGVDSCWLNRFHPAKVKEVFELPENEEPVLFMDLGYADNTGPLPNHDSRKSLEETVSYL